MMLTGTPCLERGRDVLGDQLGPSPTTARTRLHDLGVGSSQVMALEHLAGGEVRAQGTALHCWLPRRPLCPLNLP
jgi:hypothetical protein